MLASGRAAQSGSRVDGLESVGINLVVALAIFLKVTTTWKPGGINCHSQQQES
eukprot:SAG31_NODE_1600_length_7791_cov_15.201508_2_plen_53_part_00